MLRLWSLALLVLAVGARAETAYVSDELVLGVYADKTSNATRVTTLKSGASLEVLARDGEFANVRLTDGREGWVKSSYLTPREPAAARAKKLEEELQRVRRGSPAPPDAAATQEIARLTQALAASQAELAAKPTTDAAAPPDRAPRRRVLWAILWTLAVGGAGFIAGYQTLGAKIRRKFGGVKVY
jgi:uncharacterized protein YgiM (DUF1202 family)